MAEKIILPFGDPVLRKIAKPVEDVNPRIIKLLADLADTLYAAEGRAGLAAPQIGILRRVVVMDVGDGLIELINPIIIESSGEQIGAEACLSYPGYRGLVTRAQTVKVSTLTRAGDTIVLEAEGFRAICMQHEIDHLNGVLFIDHVKEPYVVHEETGHRVRVMDAQKLSRPM
ncbi:peptide deformylase [Paenibacillus sacheonensis]|uniref:Peptide deformylase n=1 Tax=Paenibacillus sacheonensis TaxID=742054 RepID=A0A7X4YLF6_9BACL|nr:peptide deformylase [Paenibacillus sacheonensis]MBM7568271.1 peptide deformylase [Paenibacillus sacheonensis]NBC68542.1 peptide deformylase [Paenibacillus sacheonensis]